VSRLITALVVIVLAVAAVGYYLDWFHVSTSRTNDQTDINITVDKDKIKKDEQKARESIQDAGREVKEQTGKVIEKGKEEKPKP
jgi:hypothetical protein